ncbi:prolyl oligopeptidase family serine peptidase, partial [Citrobacter sp. Cpo090]|uniref:alpha/beta hydrolase family protein n=1 Tax=Citrobacter sp. Cpo090 TaxID=2985139 RepID=UPI002576E747
MKLKNLFCIITLAFILAGCDESDVNKTLQKREKIHSSEIIKDKRENEKAMLKQISVIKIPDTGHMVVMSNKSLRESRDGYSTQIIADSFTDSGRILTPPRDTYILTKYPTQLGDMTAYVTPNPKDGKRHPAVIWISGGYGGLSDSEDFFWREHDRDNDQSASAFRKAGLVVMLPSFRGEDKNPGRYEMFYGELDDIEAAYDWLSKQSYVDPERIYLAGHSTGGTRVLLASEYSTKFRGYFSLGGVPDLKARVEGGEMSVIVPFKRTKREFQLRSPARYVKSIKKPTWYFEGEEAYWQAFDNIAKIANKEK